MSEIDTAALRASHARDVYDDYQFGICEHCRKCGRSSYWPCEPLKLADEIDRLRARLAEVEALVVDLDNAIDYGALEDENGERWTPLSPVVAFIDAYFVRAAAAGDRGGLGFSGLCPTCRGIGRHLDHCPSGVSTDPAPVRAGGNSAETPEPWPDVDAARFLAHTYAEPPAADHVAIFDGPPLLDECGQPFPCAHRAHNPDLNHPMAGGGCG